MAVIAGRVRRMSCEPRLKIAALVFGGFAIDWALMRGFVVDIGHLAFKRRAQIIHAANTDLRAHIQNDEKAQENRSTEKAASHADPDAFRHAHGIGGKRLVRTIAAR